MGIITSSISGGIQEQAQDLLIKQRLLDLKQQKRARDYQIATKMATTRDRVHWMIAFYTVMGSIALARMIKLRKITPLPLDTVPFFLVPFLAGYQFDFAYGTKANRIDKMAREILEDESYWFNQPMELPETLKPHYKKLMEEINAKRAEMGLPPEKDWAK